MFAEGYDVKRFLEALQKEKNAQPNIDFYTREELKQLIRKFKTDSADGNLEESQKNIDLGSSTAQMFD